MKNNPSVVTRYAPSPTGHLHVGSYRTAIFSFLYARHHGGKFILRIEDTDKERNKQEYTDNILESLKWLNLGYDEIHYQSERKDRHQFYLQKLIDEGKAYEAEEAKGDGNDPTSLQRELHGTPVIRFKNPNIKVSFADKIRGRIEFDTTELKDFVIAKSMTEPLFHLAVVVDDYEMGVTDVIRGEDHISNTPRQILIQQAIGATTPSYAHLPLVLATDRTKFSKRKGALAMTEYRDRGYLPEAMLNYISLVGWNPGTEQEIFTEEELIKIFDLAEVHKAGAIFDEVKLNWVNKEHMKRMPPDEFKNEAIKRILKNLSTLPPYEKRLDKVMEIIKERISYFGEIDEMILGGELGYFFENPKYSKDLLIPSPKMLKGKEMSREEVGEVLIKVKEILETIDEDNWSKESVKDALWRYAEEKGKGAVLWPFRVALSGREKSTDPFTISEIIGKSDTIDRIDHAATFIP